MAWNLKSDRPIYSQLIEHIELLIVSGIYPAGSKLPSVRDLAGEASVNPNTMQRALAQLENDGLLYSQRTSGRYVTEDVDQIMKIKNGLAQGLIKEFIENMENLGYDVKQAIQLLERTIEEEK
ncbi:GntR family transcriptional regulator [Caproiciproducens galactitolivorans]|uniref:GntR family transcriptional regulator n=1 Tax=Caproiciproducens galactitolivorans TaxID=642589 RepID=A0ABT4BX64_9FIRM|nr:GntR family transcriptional regulator [Caproiciproducens galactitolivorans]MCY1714538.1 GntR family transcriptional regulator [Caproiciproducens galactitolivorans]